MDERALSQRTDTTEARSRTAGSAEHVSVSGQKQWLALTDMISDCHNTPTSSNGQTKTKPIDHNLQGFSDQMWVCGREREFAG